MSAHGKSKHAMASEELLYRSIPNAKHELDMPTAIASTGEVLKSPRRGSLLSKPMKMLATVLLASGVDFHRPRIIQSGNELDYSNPVSRERSNGNPDRDRRALLSSMSVGLLLGAASPSFASESSLQFDGRNFVAVPQRSALQAKWLEKFRIFLQDEADNIQYQGELAPGGAPPANWLVLVPIVQMQATLRKLEPSIADVARWDDCLNILSSGSFRDLECKRVFNAYSDNIYYASGTEEANAFLLGGSTPSSKQSTQYLMRNEVLKCLNEFRDEITYQKGLAADGREPEVMKEVYTALMKAFADYLELANPEDLKKASEAVYG